MRLHHRARWAGRLRRLWSGTGGQAAVEFALAAPVALLLLVATVELGQLFYTRLSMRHLAQQATRFAVTGQVLNDPETGDPLSRALSVESLIYRQAEGLRVEVDSVRVDPADGGEPGEVVRVTVHYRFDLSLPWIERVLTGASGSYAVRVAMKNEPVF